MAGYLSVTEVKVEYLGRPRYVQLASIPNDQMWKVLEQPTLTGFSNRFKLSERTIREATYAFKAVAMNLGDDVERLENTYTALIQPLRKVDFHDAAALEGVTEGQHFNENLFHTVMNMVMVQARMLFASELQLYSALKEQEEIELQLLGKLKKKKKKNPDGLCRSDIIVVNKELGLAIITEMKYGDTPLDQTSAKKLLDWYADALSKMLYVKYIKLIAVAVHSDRTVETSCTILPNIYAGNGQ